VAVLLVVVVLAATVSTSGFATAQQGVSQQEVLVRDQLIANQENLLNTYRCLFGVDSHAVSGGCEDPVTVVAGVAHEFKNTLGHIKTTAEWGAAGGDAQRALRLIRSHVGDGVSGVNEMLTTTLRDGPEARSKVSLLSEINKVLGVVASTLQMVRITIRLQVPAELVLVTRRSELMLALLNLIHNAGQATTERNSGGGTVTVTGREEDDRCILEVTDGAGGVDPAAVGRLFDRGHGTGAGTGVGLHLARRLVERNDGSLTYHPIPGGSCFRIALPMAPSPGGVDAVRVG